MIFTLSLILLILLILVAGLRGFKTFLCLYLNYFLVIMYIIFMMMGLSPIVMAFITCILSSITSLFILNGINKKTTSSFISIMIVLVIMFIMILFITNNANIQGFSYEDLDNIAPYSFDIAYSMKNVLIGMFMVSIIGTVTDTSLSIASALNEVYENNKRLSQKELYKSGINVGKDILSTTINTLYFAFLAGFIGFFFLHYASSIEYIINYKVFAEEVIGLLFAFISSILIIPITSYIISKRLKKN